MRLTETQTQTSCTKCTHVSGSYQSQIWHGHSYRLHSLRPHDQHSCHRHAVDRRQRRSQQSHRRPDCCCLLFATRRCRFVYYVSLEIRHHLPMLIKCRFGGIKATVSPSLHFQRNPPAYLDHLSASTKQQRLTESRCILLCYTRSDTTAVPH